MMKNITRSYKYKGEIEFLLKLHNENYVKFYCGWHYYENFKKKYFYCKFYLQCLMSRFCNNFKQYEKLMIPT